MLGLLRCPISHQRLVETPAAIAQDLIARRQQLRNREDEVPAEFTAGLSTADGKLFYPVRELTPVLIPGEAIALPQPLTP